MRKPLNKRPDAPLLSSPEVEQMLRASAEWEPDAPLPHDFAAFTRKALEKRERTPVWTRRFGGAGGLRSALAVGLASACVLWMGGKLNVSPEAVTSPPISYAAASLSAPAWELLPPSPRLTLAVDDTAQPVKAAPQPVPLSDYRTVPAAHHTFLGHSRTNTAAARRVWHTKAGSVDKPSTQGSDATASLWKTETVERPAWGALVPVPTAAECAAMPSAGEQTGVETSEPAEGEASSAILPVVLDVALPDVENPMPAPTPDAGVTPASEKTTAPIR